MLWRMFDPSEPALETGDDRAKVEGSQCVTISSPLDILLVDSSNRRRARRVVRERRRQCSLLVRLVPWF